jgi:hypothetical protein
MPPWPTHLNDTFLDVALDSWMKQEGLTKSWLFFDRYHEDRGLVSTRCAAHGHHDTCHLVLPECCNHASCKPRCPPSLLALSTPLQSPCTFYTFTVSLHFLHPSSLLPLSTPLQSPCTFYTFTVSVHFLHLYSLLALLRPSQSSCTYDAFHGQFSYHFLTLCQTLSGTSHQRGGIGALVDMGLRKHGADIVAQWNWYANIYHSTMITQPILHLSRRKENVGL